MRTFGIREEHKPYVNRLAAYGVILNASQNKVAILHNKKSDYFLPGGGFEDGETLEGCMKREAIEETGSEVEIERFFGSA